jgi:type III restriction enzyme
MGTERSILHDSHPDVAAFVKNAGLGIRYVHNGQVHDYVPDFLIRLKCPEPVHVILETKGYDPLEGVKREAAQRWVAAVNADGTYGRWTYCVCRKPEEVRPALTAIFANVAVVGTSHG